MHEQRTDFVQKVQQNVMHDLNKNGLELESVSLTGFDQTDLQYFNKNNAFDAEGRARLAKIIEQKRKETNDIEQENRILIEQRNLLADKQSLDIEQERLDAQLSQQQAIEMRKAQQQAEIIKQQQLREQEEREAEISKQRAIEAAEIEKSKQIEAQEIEKIFDMFSKIHQNYGLTISGLTDEDEFRIPPYNIKENGSSGTSENISLICCMQANQSF